METVLVTGAYGLLGRYVVRELKESGYFVLAFGRDEKQLAEMKDERCGIYAGDFCDPRDIMRAAEGVDYVIHCGALLKTWGRRVDFMRTNVSGTENVLAACEKNHVRRFVYVSSPSAYATKDNLHITEADYNESNRMNHYIESKIAAERLVRTQDRVPYAMIRPRGLCGVGDRNMLPVLIRANETVGIPLFQRGNVFVDLCCAENAALALRLCMERDEALGQVYNITNGEPRRLTELAEEMFSAIDMKPKYIPLPFGPTYACAGGIEFFYRLFGIYDKAPAVTRYNVCTLGKSQIFDITKAKTELGYRPQITLSEMIIQYAEAYKAGRA